MNSSQQPVRLGIIGLGNIARQHIKHIQEKQAGDCVLAATCSRSTPDDSALPVPHFNELGKLLESGTCDAVLIATPTRDHLAMGKAALEAGLHVLMEKPIDFSAVDRQPVDLAFALFAPVDAGVDHLKALALVARTLRDTSFCTKLRANRDPGTLFTILTEGRSDQAA